MFVLNRYTSTGTAGIGHYFCCRGLSSACGLCGRIGVCWEDGALHGRLIDIYFLAHVAPGISHLHIPCSLVGAGPTALRMRAAGLPFVLPEVVRKKALAASLINVHTSAP